MTAAVAKMPASQQINVMPKGNGAPATPETFLADGSLKAICAHAAHFKVSDIFVAGAEPVMYSVYGRLAAMAPKRLSLEDVYELLRQATAGDTARTIVTTGEPYDSSFETEINGERIRWRLNASATMKFGKTNVRMVMRRIDGMPPTTKDLYLPSELVDVATNIHRGLCIVSGPTGSGKSTTLASIIRHRLEDPDDQSHIVTLEKPIEFVYESVMSRNSIVTQHEIGKNLPSFHRGVENALRQKPNVILVGESRDPETISATILAAQTGHGVYTTAHDTGVPNTISRMVRAFPAEERDAGTQDLINVLDVAISQNLVPTTDGKRVALREYLVFDEEAKDELRQSDDLFRTTQRILRERGRPMMMDVNQYFKEGRIDASVMRKYERLAQIADKR